MNTLPDTQCLQIRSLIQPNGELDLALVSKPVPEPKPHEVLIRVEASPINPSDLGYLFAGADMSKAVQSGSRELPRLTAQIPAAVMGSLKARLGISMPVGNEGAGVVVAAGSAPEAQALMGKTVTVLGGGMYAQYRCVPAEQCLVLPAGTKAADGASAFINPLTALGMVECMRLEGHSALVHTAAASNLGQMLNRICLKDGIGLVNIVRKPEQEQSLRAMGAVHVCNSQAPDFAEKLTAALVATGATIAFDAIGGGPLAGQILECMETALIRDAKAYSRYGSTTHKQVYIYGGLDQGPTTLGRNYGMSWGVDGWLISNFLARLEPARSKAIRQRIAAELTTTFASHYTAEISLAQVLDPKTIEIYRQSPTGQKYLVNPNKGVSG